MNKESLIKEHFFRPRWYSVFINPYFIDRYSLYKNIVKFSKTLKPNLKILDVGCGEKPYLNLFKNQNYIGIDIEGGGHSEEYKKPDKFFDGKNIPFEESEFDAIICTQVLEHTEEPLILIGEMYRVLKPGGQLFLSAPFVGNEHEQPYDFWRFTQFSHKKMFVDAKFTEIKIFPTCGFFATLGQLTSSFVFENTRIGGAILKLIISILFIAPIQIISIFLDKIFRNKRLTLNYIVIAKK